MKEAAIIHSPHAYAPMKELTQEERDERYRTRMDESFKPYTVIDVLTKVYHRDFADDLSCFIGRHPEKFRNLHGDPTTDLNISHVWVNGLRIIRPESAFFQASEDFRVDIYVDTNIKLEEVRSGNNYLKKRYNITPKLRLRYSFDFRPCHLDCRFVDVITDDKDSLQAKDEAGISVDKYLLPVLKGDADYRRLAVYMQRRYGKRATSLFDEDTPFDPMDWLMAMGIKVKYGIFPENGVLGEYFFGFGTADIVDMETGEIFRSAEINPGTIIVNREIVSSEGTKNATLAHEGAHHFLDHFFFLLQMTHGHRYCSYMCKRFTGTADPHEKWTPIDIMEMQANKLPGFMMIQDKSGKAYAQKLMSSYGGERNLANMRKLVNDMAQHYATTKTAARTRLLDFGYNEVRGLQQSANGSLIPSYISGLCDDETYTIDEREGVKEYIRNPDFRKLIDTGTFLYLEGHYCLNAKEYVCADQFGFQHLTLYAREHMAECCLPFQKTYQNVVTRLINGILQKGVGRGRQEIRYQKKDGSNAITEEGMRLRAQIMKDNASSLLIRKSFNDLTCDLMDKRKMSKPKLAEITGISQDTIQRMRNSPESSFSIQAIVAVAIALQLPPDTSTEYIRRSPCKFGDSDEMRCYQYAMSQWYLLPVPVVNKKLVEMGITPLTPLVQGFDENGVELEDGAAAHPAMA